MRRLLRACGMIIVLSMAVVLGATAYILFAGGPGARQATNVSTISGSQTGRGDVDSGRVAQDEVVALFNTSTPIPPATSPTSVPEMASVTAIRPTDTTIPPTLTAVPPTATAIPPSRTPVPTTASVYSVNRYASPQTRYTHGVVNLRKGPDTSYDLLGSVPVNADLQVVGKSGEWYLIRHNGREVFIAGWLTFDAPLQQQSSQPAAPQQPGFSCSPRKSCGQMSSCAEARFYLTQCQRGDLDHDSDGTPCETICGSASVQQPAQQPTAPAQQPAQQPAAPQQPSYTCNCSKTCGEMSSCQEAYFQLNNCGCRKRDGNNDGVPCESICR